MKSGSNQSEVGKKPKRHYEKPEIRSQGRVEEITLKDLGIGDAFLFRGGSGGGGGGGFGGGGFDFNAS